MTNRKRQRRLKAKLKAEERALQSSRVARELSKLDEDKKMTEAQRKENQTDVLAGIDAQAARNIVIVNEEFAKNATPDVTKAAILARFAKRDAAFKASVVAEFGEEEVADDDLVGNLDV